MVFEQPMTIEDVPMWYADLTESSPFFFQCQSLGERNTWNLFSFMVVEIIHTYWFMYILLCIKGKSKQKDCREERHSLQTSNERSRLHSPLA